MPACCRAAAASSGLSYSKELSGGVFLCSAAPGCARMALLSAAECSSATPPHCWPMEADAPTPHINLEPVRQNVAYVYGRKEEAPGVRLRFS